MITSVLPWKNAPTKSSKKLKRWYSRENRVHKLIRNRWYSNIVRTFKWLTIRQWHEALILNPDLYGTCKYATPWDLEDLFFFKLLTNCWQEISLFQDQWRRPQPWAFQNGGNFLGFFSVPSERPRCDLKTPKKRWKAGKIKYPSTSWCERKGARKGAVGNNRERNLEKPTSRFWSHFSSKKTWWFWSSTSDQKFVVNIVNPIFWPGIRTKKPNKHLRLLIHPSKQNRGTDFARRFQALRPKISDMAYRRHQAAFFIYPPGN